MKTVFSARGTLVLAFLMLSAFLTVTKSLAQGGEGWTWYSVRGANPGTPPLIRVADADVEHTRFQIVVEGFWARERTGPDQRTYTELSFPGMGTNHQLGAPNLPVLGFDLAVPTGAEQVIVGEIEFLETAQYEMTPWPRTIPERDHPEGEPEEFVLDERIYFGRNPYPAAPHQPVPVERSGPIPSARGEIMPCTWSPDSGILTIATQVEVTFTYPGTPTPQPGISLEMDRIAVAIYKNWNGVAEYFAPNNQNFEADYLFVYPEDLKPELQPLIDQKKARGYQVTELYVENMDGTCESIRDAIDTWLRGLPFWRDHYALLVGDVDVIPLCTSPDLEWDSVETSPTDDLYASPGGDDLSEEIYLGRLSVEDNEDLANQVAKILAYEDHAAPLVNFRQCGLVAHREGSPGKYEGAHESVRLASYATSPVFTTFYGSAGASDGDVIDYIDPGVGIVAYRGHGSWSAWTGWNSLFQDFTTSDIGALDNAGRTPVIWSFACNNNELGANDCIGENWLDETEGQGAVSHYGSTIPSYTVQNHELDRAMFRAVWDYGLVTQSHAIMVAEQEMADKEGSDNAWMYLLLGDPDMKIKRNAPPGWNLIMPEELSVCEFGTCQIELQVLNQVGQPLEQVLVSAWKGAAPGNKADGDEVFANAYTSAGGSVALEVAPSTAGAVDIVVRDLDGNVFVTSIPVVDDISGVPGDGLTLLRLSAAPSITGGNTSFRLARPLLRAVRVEIYDIRGRQVRHLRLDAGAVAVAWDGRDEGGRQVPSGVYYARVTAEGATSTTRVTMVR